MNAKYQVINTYKSLSDWHGFRLRLFGEGILVGLAAGLVICLFRFGLEQAEELRSLFYLYLTTAEWYWHLGWFLLLLIIGQILVYLIHLEPMAAGSGIPQVKGVLLGLVKLRWLSVLCTKLVGGILGIGSGLSLGREGPSIQLGAVAAQGISRLLGRTRMEERYLLTSGASAGLAASFNAPLAGVIFALEELHRNFSVAVMLPAMAAAMTATIVSRALFGAEAVFIFSHLPALPLNYYGYVILIAIVTGFCGVIFNKGLLTIPVFYSLPYFQKPIVKICFPLIIAGILGYFLPQVLGGGNKLINSLAAVPVSLQMLLLLLVFKLLFTLLSYGCGVPGGFFLPMLVIGALCGSICSNILVSLQLITADYAADMVIMAMAALFSASVRAPITGTVLIMEMTASYEQLLPLAISSMVALIIAELCRSKPIYEELLQRSLRQKQPEADLLEQRNIAEFAVCSGSTAENKLVKDINWPADTLLVDIKRGEQRLIPAGNTRIRSGDFLYILTHNKNIVLLQQLTGEKQTNK